MRLRFSRHLGYRGRVLTTYGIAWIVIGVTGIIYRLPHAAGFTPWVNLSGWIWIVSGILGIIGGHIVRDRWFYAIIGLPPLLVTAAAAVNYGLSLLPGPPAPRGIGAAAVYAILAITVWWQNQVKEPGTETVSTATKFPGGDGE